MITIRQQGSQLQLNISLRTSPSIITVWPLVPFHNFERLVTERLKSSVCFQVSLLQVPSFRSYSMASSEACLDSASMNLLQHIQTTLGNMQKDYKTLAASIETINGRVNVLSDVKEVKETSSPEPPTAIPTSIGTPLPQEKSLPSFPIEQSSDEIASTSKSQQPGSTSRIILTTYPGQSGIHPLPMQWGHKDPVQRGPVVVSRTKSTVRRRNGKSRVFI